MTGGTDAQVLPAMAPGDWAQLQSALVQVDKETQQFLGPMLALEPVQHLLLTFVRDSSRSFADHVWDPMTQRVLQQLRGTGAGAGKRASLMDFSKDVSRLYSEEMHRRFAPRDFMAEVEAAQEDGKRKFKKADFYPAMNAFNKSLQSLVLYHEDDHYGETIEPSDWEEPELRARYVTLCNNLAVCAIKLKDTAAIERFARKALAVDEQSSKSLYALAKLHVIKLMFEEARQVLAQALVWHPENALLAKFEKEIDAAEQKQTEMVIAVAAAKKIHDERVAEEAQASARNEQERLLRLSRTQDVTPLPPLDSNNASGALHTYFMRIKHELLVEIDQKHNPDNGEASLFECNLSDGTTGVLLAEAVMAPSKKIAKNKASVIAIERLWAIKRECGKLLPEDEEKWEAREQKRREGEDSNSSGDHLNSALTDDATVGTTDKYVNEVSVVRITSFERQHTPAMLLNQLNQQNRLHVMFEITDVSENPLKPIFECVYTVRGERLEPVRAASKKKARAEAARNALVFAQDRGWVVNDEPGIPENDPVEG